MATLLDQVFRRDFRLSSGRVSELTGGENVKDAIKNRFAVFSGAIPFRPQYGTNLKKYSNEPITKELENLIVQEVRLQVERDPRIQLVRKITIDTNTDGLVQVEFEAVLVGENEDINVKVVI